MVTTSVERVTDPSAVKLANVTRQQTRNSRTNETGNESNESGEIRRSLERHEAMMTTQYQ